MSKNSICWNGNLPVTANAIPTPNSNVNAETAKQSCAPVTLKQRLSNLLREVFGGRGEYLGLTPD